MNTNFRVIGLTRLEKKTESIAPEADALTTRPSELLRRTLCPMCALSNMNYEMKLFLFFFAFSAPKLMVLLKVTDLYLAIAYNHCNLELTCGIVPKPYS